MSSTGLKRSEPTSSNDAARYIADMSRGLAGIARESELDVIAYLLELVRLEAEETAQNPDFRK